ncbi:MAG: 3-phosphoserine/phosphohydroxythreonine transaminase [Chloroflexota bacterium]|jgi:phosphoserine aminotransferase
MSTHNFNAGPAVLPAEVIAHIQAELPNYHDTGISILESSHRSKEYEQINQRVIDRLRRILALPETYHIGLLQGGASHQFAMLPLNVLQPLKSGAYVLTGVWAEKAYEEAGRIGNAHVAASTKDQHYRFLPPPETWQIPTDAAYVHITSNNTIYGTQWSDLPSSDIPLVVDMSSDIASRPLQHTKAKMIYAGAQKNLGPAGVTVVAIADDFYQQMHANAPMILRYSTHITTQSLYNTPPTFSVYVLDLVLGWIEAQGIDALAQKNHTKAKLIYDVIDQSGGFYRGHSDMSARSQMNITFRISDEALEKTFLNEAQHHGMIGLAGHRSVGGLRASLYNALPIASAHALAELMREFQRRHG